MSRGPLRILLLRTSAVGAAFRDVAPPAVSAPLGILYLSSALERALGSRIEIEAESLSLAVRSSSEIEDWLRAREPDLVGISSSLLEEPRCSLLLAEPDDGRKDPQTLARLTQGEP